MTKNPVGEEYTRRYYIKKRAEERQMRKMRLEFKQRGGEITKCPPFTPGGLRVYSTSDRPERGVTLTPEGIKIDFREDFNE